MTDLRIEEYRGCAADRGARNGQTVHFHRRAWCLGHPLLGDPGYERGAAGRRFPLLVLAGTFEAVFALHAGVERIGRYLQVFHDDTWEQTAMAFGPPLAEQEPILFAGVFGLATVCNFLQCWWAVLCRPSWRCLEPSTWCSSSGWSWPVAPPPASARRPVAIPAAETSPER